MIQSKEDLYYYLREDRKYYSSKPNLNDWLLRSDFYYIWKFMTELRWYEYRENTSKGLFRKIVMKYHKFKFYRLMHKTQLYIYPNVFGPGLYIPHKGHILTSTEATIGKNCVIRPGTLIASNLGQNNQKVRRVVIGDNVEFSEGCKILCKKIGSNVNIGPNAVVSRNVPDNSIVMGNPGEIVPKLVL